LRRIFRRAAWGISPAILSLAFWQHSLPGNALETTIDNNRVSMFGRDVGPLDTSWLLLFDAKSWFFICDVCAEL
jgi:hypothetical protein